MVLAAILSRRTNAVWDTRMSLIQSMIFSAIAYALEIETYINIMLGQIHKFRKINQIFAQIQSENVSP